MAVIVNSFVLSHFLYTYFSFFNSVEIVHVWVTTENIVVKGNSRWWKSQIKSKRFHFNDWNLDNFVCERPQWTTINAENKWKIKCQGQSNKRLDKFYRNKHSNQSTTTISIVQHLLRMHGAALNIPFHSYSDYVDLFQYWKKRTLSLLNEREKENTYSTLLTWKWKIQFIDSK